MMSLCRDFSPDARRALRYRIMDKARAFSLCLYPAAALMLASIILLVLHLGAVLSPGQADRVLASSTSSSTTVTFSGFVRDATTNDPIPNTTITVGTASTVSNTAGHYSLTIPASTSLRITAVAPGYLALTVVLADGGAVLQGN